MPKLYLKCVRVHHHNVFSWSLQSGRLLGVNAWYGLGRPSAWCHRTPAVYPSTPSWGEIWSSLDASRSYGLQCSSSRVSAWLQTRQRGSCLPDLCFLSLKFVDICDSILGFGGFLAWWCQRFLVLVWSLHGLFDCAAPFIWFRWFVAFVRWDGKLVLNCSVVNLWS